MKLVLKLTESLQVAEAYKLRAENLQVSFIILVYITNLHI